MGVQILGMDVNASGEATGWNQVRWPPSRSGARKPGERFQPPPGLPDGSDWGIRLSLVDVKGIETAQVLRIEAGQPYACLSDFWARAQIGAPVVENLIEVGAFDALYGIDLGYRSEAVTR